MSMFLARKIARAKWGTQEELVDGEISADAITGDLRTRGNSLSFWQCHDGAEHDIDNAALAIAAAGDRLDKLDVVWLTDDELQADGHTLRNTRGQTPVSELVDEHVDIVKLDYVRLGKVANRVMTAIEGRQFRRLGRARVKKLLSTAVGQGRINIDDLKPRLREEIEA